MEQAPDLESPVFDRSRTVVWEDPALTRQKAGRLSGLEIMRGIRDGTVAPPPMALLIGFDCVVAEPGEIVMQLTPEESLENPIGLIHGGVAATMLDTAMGAAVNTLLKDGQMSVTVSLTLSYIKALTVGSGPLRAEGKVIKLGARTAYVEGRVTDGAGQLAVHAVGNFSIMSARA